MVAFLGYVAGGWRVDRLPRFLADLTGTGRADIVGFGNDGVFVALSRGDGTFDYTPQPVIADLGYVARETIAGVGLVVVVTEDGEKLLRENGRLH